MFLVKAGAGVLAVALDFVLARLLGAHAFGEYAYVLAWVAILAVFSGVGLNWATIRYVSEYRTQSEFGLLAGLLRFGRTFSVIAGSALGLLLWLGHYWLGLSGGSEGLLIIVGVGAVLVPFRSLAQMIDAQLKGFGRVVLGEMPQTILEPVALVSIVVVVGAVGTELTGLVAVTSALGATVLGLCLSLVVLSRTAATSVSDVCPERAASAWIGTGMRLMLVSGFATVLNRADIVMLGWFLGTTAAGEYQVASRLSTGIGLASAAVVTAMSPIAAAHWVEGRLKELQRPLALVTAAVVLVTGVGGLVLILVRRPLLGLFGPGFTAASGALVLLTMSQVVNAFSATGIGLLAMTGHETTAAWIMGGAVLVNLAMNLWLIPRLGMVGGGVATLAAITVVMTSTIASDRRLLGIDPTPLPALRM